MNARPSGFEDVLYAFGPFTLDPVSGVLRRHGAVVALPNKSLELLTILVERRGQLICKEELMNELWPDLAVEENNLARHISNLRKVLEDHRSGHEFIVTAAGRGYRFVAVVQKGSREELDVHSTAAAEFGRHLPEAAVAAVESPAVTTRVSATRPPGRNWRLGLIAAGAAVVLVSVWGALSFQGRAVPPGDARLWQLTFDPGVQMQPSWSPDGRRLAYASDRNGNADIWIQDVDQPTATRVTSETAHDWQPAWSPDGKTLAFRSERSRGGVFLVPASGGAERRISDFGYYPQWSPDGSRILFYDEHPRGIDGVGRANALYTIAVDGAPAKEIFPGIFKSFASFRARWHPDGRISVWGKHQDSGWSFWTSPAHHWNPVRADIPAEIERHFQDANLLFVDFAWSPRGDAVYFEGREGNVTNVWRVNVNRDTLRWLAAKRLTTSAERNVNISVSPDGGKLAFSVRNEHTKLWSLPLDPTGTHITGEGAPVLSEGADVQFDLSADGRELIYRTLRRGTQELRKRSLLDGQSQLLASGHALSVPRLSRDGQFVVFRRNRPIAQDIGTVEQDVVLLDVKSGKTQLLTAPQRVSRTDLSTFVPFDWSADGRRLLTPCHVGDYVGICLMSVDKASQAGRDMRIIASSPDRSLVQAQFSPDERLVCFNAVLMAGRPRTSRVHVAPVDGGPWVAITSGEYLDDKPRWSRDGRIIYFASLRNGYFNIWAQPFDSAQGLPVGAAFPVTQFEALEHTIFSDVSRMHMAVSRERLIVPMTDVAATVWVLENVDR